MDPSWVWWNWKIKMSRMGLKPTSLAFWASVLPLHHLGSLMSPLYPRPPILQLLAYTRPPDIVSIWCLQLHTYRQWPFIIHTQGKFNNHTVCSLYRIMIKPTSVVGVMNVGNNLPRVGLEPTSLGFPASMLRLHHIGSLMSPLYPRPSACASEVSADYYTV